MYFQEEKEKDIKQKLAIFLNQLEKTLGKDKFFGGSEVCGVCPHAFYSHYHAYILM